MRVGLVSPYDFASPGGVNKRGWIKIPPRTPLSQPRLGGVWKVDVWVTAGVNPASTSRWETL